MMTLRIRAPLLPGTPAPALAHADPPAHHAEQHEQERHADDVAPLRGRLDALLPALERKGGAWRMTKPVVYAVNATAVDKMVEALGALRTIDVISDNKAKHAALEVDDALGVEVKVFEGSKQLAHFIVGVTRDEMTMVRLPGGDQVYRVKGSLRGTFN
jgi:hypothetical protein